MQVLGYFLGTLCFVGTIGNLLILIVLQRKHQKKSTNWLIQALAVVDCLYLHVHLLAAQLEYFACGHEEWLPLAAGRLSATVAPYLASAASLVRMISVWTVVLVTVDRYIAVCLPGEVRLRSVRRAKVAVACVTFLSVVCCTPLFVDGKIDTTSSLIECNHTTSAVAKDDQVPRARSWWLITYQICLCAIRTPIPFVTLVVLSSCMIVRLRRIAGKIRPVRTKCRFSDHQQQTKFGKMLNWRERLTATLAAVIGLFVVCQLPQFILRCSVLLQQLTPADLRLDDRLMRQAGDVASGLLVVHASANFFVYCAVGQRFRSDLVDLFARRSAKNNMDAIFQRKNEFKLAIHNPPGAANTVS